MRLIMEIKAKWTKIYSLKNSPFYETHYMVYVSEYEDRQFCAYIKGFIVNGDRITLSDSRELINNLKYTPPSCISEQGIMNSIDKWKIDNLTDDFKLKLEDTIWFEK
jgi:hypothetical protein